VKGNISARGENSWRLKFDIGQPGGARQIQYVTVRGTKREAQRRLTELLSQVDKGEYAASSTETLGDYLARWGRDWAAINVSPKAAERYIDLMRVHVTPHIGSIRLQRLRSVNLAELYPKLLRESGLAPRTVAHVHRVLHRALVIAVQWGLITRNPADQTTPPPVADIEVEILTEAQVSTVLRGLRGEELYQFVALALGSGMRRGELCALAWSAVDLSTGKVRVERSLEQTRAGLRIKQPKTKHGRRTIALPASLVAELREYRRTQQELRLRLGLGKMPDDALVFPNLDGSSPRKPDAVTKAWRRVIKRLGLSDVSLHALRHTHASQLIASGMDILTISRRLGHGSPTITLGVYGHLFSDTDAKAAEIMEAAFARAAETE
jgi:integrase